MAKNVSSEVSLPGFQSLLYLMLAVQSRASHFFPHSSLFPYLENGAKTHTCPHRVGENKNSVHENFLKILFIHERHRERREAEGEAGSMREPDVGLDPRTLS